MATAPFLTGEQKAAYARDGFLVLRDLFSSTEIMALRERLMGIHRQSLDANSPLREYYQPKTGEDSPDDKTQGDALQQFPRILHPHRFDAMSKRVLLDERIKRVLTELLGEEPLAAQSMVYFKPPGARGQALHQDNFYLKCAPNPCLASWLALDDADAENGTLLVIPGSHHLELLCPHAADLTQSFTTEEVSVPAGMKPMAVDLRAGDTLFFHGRLIHGSHPNRSRDRFRRAFICHYVPHSTREMNAGMYPLHTFAGKRVERGHASGGGPCGNEDWATFRAAIDAQMHENSALQATAPQVRLGEYYMFGPRGATEADRSAHARTVSGVSKSTFLLSLRRFGGRARHRWRTRHKGTPHEGTP